MKKQAWLLLLPGLLITLLFIIFPMIQILYPTLTTGQSFGHLYVQFFQDALNRQILLRTIGISLVTTFLVLLFSLPLAYWITRQKNPIRGIVLLVVLFPMLMNGVVLSFTWTVLLGKSGFVNQVLMTLHVISHPLDILYTDTAIVIGSVYVFIPIMVISLISNFADLNPNLEKAAAVLGANRRVIFNHIVIPQVIPGILTGTIWTFAWMMTSYTTPAVLGGTKDMVLSTLIYQEAMNNQNWTESGVISFILVIFSLLSLGLIKLAISSLDRRFYRV